VYEPEPSIATDRAGLSAYDRGPITEDLQNDPAAYAASELILRLITEVGGLRIPRSWIRGQGW
jgi:hypothetical protein